MVFSKKPKVNEELGREKCPICGKIVIFGLPYVTTLEECAMPLIKGCGHVIAIHRIDGVFSASFEEKK